MVAITHTVSIIANNTKWKMGTNLAWFLKFCSLINDHFILIFLKNFFETVRKDLYHIQLIVAGGIILLIADFLIILLANYEKYPSSDLHRIFVLVDRQQGKSPADRLLPG